MNSLYECISEGSDFLKKLFEGILFSSSLHVIPKEVFLIAILLCPRSSRETASRVIQLFHYKAPPAVREWIYRDFH